MPVLQVQRLLVVHPRVVVVVDASLCAAARPLPRRRDAVRPQPYAGPHEAGRGARFHCRHRAGGGEHVLRRMHCRTALLLDIAAGWDDAGVCLHRVGARAACAGRLHRSVRPAVAQVLDGALAMLQSEKVIKIAY